MAHPNMFPRRFNNIRPYLASLIFPRFHRPPVSEMIHWLTRSGKQQRAAAFIESHREVEGFKEVTIRGFSEKFYYPEAASWIDLCQTIDEILNPKNWHHFISSETPIVASDTVVDCGAAEGLFSFCFARRAAKVFAIEPLPFWHPGLQKSLSQFSNVELVRVGVGHRNTEMRMTDNEIYSRVCRDGSVEIPVRTLDSLFAEQDIPVSFIKADIEGYEFPMLLGAEETIRRNRPKLSMTVYHDANHFVEIRDYLRNIHEDYRFQTRGIAENGNPVLLQVY